MTGSLGQNEEGELRPSGRYQRAPSGLDLQAETVRKEADFRQTKCAGVAVPGFRGKADPVDLS